MLEIQDRRYKIQESLFHVGFNITINICYLGYFPTNIYKAN